MIERGEFGGSISGLATPRPVRRGQVRASAPVLTGIAVTYGTVHRAAPEAAWSFDVFAPGCFEKSLSDGDACLRRMHDPAVDFAYQRGYPKLELHDSPEALGFRFAVPSDDPNAISLFNEVAARALPSASVGFHPIAVKTITVNDRSVRIIGSARLIEISVVTTGAVPYAAAYATDDAVRRAPPLTAVGNHKSFASATLSAQIAAQLAWLGRAL